MMCCQDVEEQKMLENYIKTLRINLSGEVVLLQAQKWEGVFQLKNQYYISWDIDTSIEAYQIM